MVSYAKVLKTMLVYALVAPTTLEDRQRVDKTCKDDRLELELIVAAPNLRKYATINPTHITPSKNFFEDLFRSNIRFLLNTKAIEVKVHEGKIKTKIEYL